MQRICSSSVCVAFSLLASNALSENEAVENSKGNRIFLYSVRNALQSS